MSVSSTRKRTQYRHIEKSDLDRGRSDERAREVAQRTAIAQRREQETNYDNADAGGDAGGDAGDQAATPSLEEKSVKQLRDRASELSIKGRSTMRKRELIRAIRMAIH